MRTQLVLGIFKRFSIYKLKKISTEPNLLQIPNSFKQLDPVFITQPNCVFLFYFNMPTCFVLINLNKHHHKL